MQLLPLASVREAQPARGEDGHGAGSSLRRGSLGLRRGSLLRHGEQGVLLLDAEEGLVEGHEVAQQGAHGCEELDAQGEGREHHGRRGEALGHLPQHRAHADGQEHVEDGARGKAAQLGGAHALQREPEPHVVGAAPAPHQLLRAAEDAQLLGHAGLRGHVLEELGFDLGLAKARPREARALGEAAGDRHDQDHVDGRDGEHRRRQRVGGNAQRADGEGARRHGADAAHQLVEGHGAAHDVVEVLVDVAPHEGEQVAAVDDVHEVALHAVGVGVLEQRAQELGVDAAGDGDQRQQRAVGSEHRQELLEAALSGGDEGGELLDGLAVEDQGHSRQHREQHHGGKRACQELGVDRPGELERPGDGLERAAQARARGALLPHGLPSLLRRLCSFEKMIEHREEAGQERSHPAPR